MSEKPKGPTMLVATEALTPPKVRIGRITRDISLPRTVPLVTLLAGGGGALLGIVLAGGFLGWGLAPIMYGATIGGGLGAFLANYSPLKGESLAKWLGLKVLTRRRRIEIDGKAVRLAVGVAYVPEAVLGPVRIRPGAVNVAPGSVDDRGVRSEDRWQRVSFDPRAVAVHHDLRDLPADEEISGRGSSGVSDALDRYRQAREDMDGLTPEDLVGIVPAERVSRRRRTKWHNTPTGELVEVEVEPSRSGEPWSARGEEDSTPPSHVGWKTPGS